MLDPQTRALLALIEYSGAKPTHELTPEEARRFYRERRAYTEPPVPAVAESRDLSAPGPGGTIALRLYRPLGAPAGTRLPVLVYFHGGGWTIGDLDTHDVLCRQLANGAGVTVVAVDYRLGPEHRFPAAVDDAVAATRWVRDNAAMLGVDEARVAVGGDSAGGNLAAVVALAARDAGETPLAFQLLIYPVTDLRRAAPSHVANGQGYMLTSESLDYYYRNYVDDPAHYLDWRASPLLHSDHARLPPAFVLTAGYDPLRDEGLQYAQRLSESGVPTTCVCFERQIHGFVPMGRAIDEGNVAVALCAAAIRRALAD